MNYASVKDTLFTGATGRELRQHPAEVRELQFFLVAGPGHDPFGVFMAELAVIAIQLGRPLKRIRESLEVLAALKFCAWDEGSGYVWVPEMAHHQFQTPLKAVDLRCVTAQRWYRQLPPNPFLGAWFDRYVLDFHLLKGPHSVERRESEGLDMPLASPLEGASKPLVLGSFVLEGEGLGEREGSGGREGEGGREQELRPVDVNAPLKGAAIDEQFERIWKVYPNAVEKKPSRAKFGTLRPTIALVDEMLAAIEQQKLGDPWLRGYIPKLVNWFEKARWQDRVQPQAPVVSAKNAASISAAQRFVQRRQDKP